MNPVEMPHSETTQKEEKVIAAVPLSFKMSGDDTVISIPRRMRKTSETPENWICEPRPRANGVIDKYYYHKEINIRCRSLKEVERFEKYGIPPARRGKGKDQEIIAAEENKSKTNENTKISPISEASAQGETGNQSIPIEKEVNTILEISKCAVEDSTNGIKIYSKSHRDKSEDELFVERFLAEAWDNKKLDN